MADMTFTGKNKIPDRKRDRTLYDMDHSAPEQPAFGMPNSLMADLISEKDPGTFSGPSTIRRQLNMPHRQIPSAEAEADRLSAGVRGTSPDSIRKEMGSRLNADFSSIRFHSDPFSESQAAQMGARAWTSGRDIYFGKGGFEPDVAAHELVHTVQQGAAKGSVAQNVVSGTVQMWSLWPFGKKSSKYDKMKGASEEADFLFRTQAGISAAEEKQNAERDEAYVKSFQREISHNQDRDAAHAAALNSRNNLRTTNKAVINSSERDQFTGMIRTVSYKTYKELMERRNKEAEKLVSYFDSLNETNQDSPDKNAYNAANSFFGGNFTLYDSIIKKIENEHRGQPEFARWKQNILKASGKEAMQTCDQATDIIDSGKSSENRYLKSDEGMRGRKADDQRSENYYKLIYKGKIGPQKKTRLDRMADHYRRMKRIEEERKAPITGKPDFTGPESDMIDLGGPEEVMNKKDSGSDLLQDIDTGIVGGGMKEKDDDILSGNIISNAPNNNIIDDNDILDLSPEENRQPSFSDPNAIIRQNGLVTDELADNFVKNSPKVKSGKKFKSKLGVAGNIGKGVNSLAQIGMIADEIDVKDGGNIYSDYINPSVTGVTGTMSALTGAAGIVTGAHDTWRNFKNIDAGGSRWEPVRAGIETLGSGSGALSGALSAMKSGENLPKVGQSMSEIGKFGGQNLIPGLNIATGAATALTGGYQAFTGQKSINQIDDQIKEFNDAKEAGTLTKDQKKLEQIFKQSRRAAELRRTGGVMKFLSGGITAGTGIATLASGPLAPLTLAILAAAGAVTGIGKFIYDKKKKKNLRKDVTAEAMGINWEEEKQKVRNMFEDEDLSDKEVRAIILKGHGFQKGTRTDAFKEINQNRAKTLMKAARNKKGGKIREMAQKVISALGVHRRKGRYTEGAIKLLAEKLGG